MESLGGQILLCCHTWISLAPMVAANAKVEDFVARKAGNIYSSSGTTAEAELWIRDEP
jgi:hypothetical protein